MNYGGYGTPMSNGNPWSEWKEHYCWIPKRVTIAVPVVNPASDMPYVMVSKWVWLKTIYYRHRVNIWYDGRYSGKTKYDYEYAENLFELIKRVSE